MAVSTLPLVRELPPPDPSAALACFADLPGVLLLESAARRLHLGRFSFLTADPFRWFKLDQPQFGQNPLDAVAAALAPLTADPLPELPTFQGGAAGLLGFDLGGVWERLPAVRPSGFPVSAVGLYDWVLAWDHVANRAWLIAQGWPARTRAERRQRAVRRLDWAAVRLAAAPPTPLRQQSATKPAAAATFPLSGHPGICSNFARDDYLSAVERVIRYIRAGDIFQANLSQQLVMTADAPPVELYRRLCRVNPAPFAGYFAAGDWAVVSASPERFLAVTAGNVETRPIKGTRPRLPDAAADAAVQAELLTSEKDRAENIMIVDLLRNDLSRVCAPGSVTVPQLCALESYQTVHHLVSAVRGQLEPGQSVWNLLAAAFPGGSISGAPKVRALEILAELEPTPRGPYCGSLFYVTPGGDADSNLLIRTLAVQGGRVQIGVGGGITAASDPAAEYEETLVKAAAMLRAVDANR